MTLPFVAAVLGCSGGVSRDIQETLSAISGRVPDVPGDIAQLSRSALRAEVTANGPYPGFDTSIYPGDGTMRTMVPSPSSVPG